MQTARDQLNRRSRFTRSSRSPGMKLSDRDLRVLLALTRYRYLPSSYLCRLVGGNATTLKWRLRELFDAALVLRPAVQWQVPDALCAPVIYELSHCGYERLRDLGLITDDQRGESSSISHFWHGLLVSELMATFEIAVRETKGLELITEGEIVSRLASRRGRGRPSQPTCLSDRGPLSHPGRPVWHPLTGWGDALRLGS